MQLKYNDLFNQLKETIFKKVQFVGKLPDFANFFPTWQKSNI